MSGSAVLAGDNHDDAVASVQDTWHYTTFSRIAAGIEDAIAKMCEKHFVADEFIRGWVNWFEAEHATRFQSWWRAWLQLNELGEAGRTDAEAQKEFNAVLRVYRDGALWCIERYIGWKKDQTAAARAAAASVGKQESMALR